MAINVTKLNTAGVQATDRYLKGLQSVTSPLYSRICEVMTTNSPVVEAPIAKMIGPARKWLGPRVARTVENTGYTIKIDKYENTVEVKREDVDDDNLGMVMSSFETLGQIAGAEYDIRVFEKLLNGEADKCYDSLPFFSASHPEAGATVANLAGSGSAPWYVFDTSLALKPMIYVERDKIEFAHRWDASDPRVFDYDVYTSGYRYRGAADFGFWQTAYKHKGALDSTNFESVMTAMMSRKNDQGESLNLGGSLLVVVPTILIPAAKKLFGRQYLAGGEENTNQGVAWAPCSRLPNA